MGIIYTLHIPQNKGFLRGHNSLSYLSMQTLFFVTLQVLPFQKFILDKISLMGWRRGQSTKFNLRKIDLKLVFGYISPCIFFFRKLPLTHPLLFIKNLKQILYLYDHGTHVKVKKKIWTSWACGAPKGPWPDFSFIL